jgi:hypothetical protein
MQPKVTRTERSSQGKNRISSLIGHTSGVALIGEKKHLPALLELPTWSSGCLGTDPSLRNCDRLYHGKTFLTAPNVTLHGLKSFGDNEALPLDRSQKRRALPFRSSHILDPIQEGPDSVRVTFSRRSPNGGPGRAKTRTQSREKRAWNSSRRSHVRSSNEVQKH